MLKDPLHPVLERVVSGLAFQVLSHQRGPAEYVAQSNAATIWRRMAVPLARIWRQPSPQNLAEWHRAGVNNLMKRRRENPYDF